jgi:phage tail P2-like protein
VSDDLLPPNASEEERALAETVARISDVPILVRQTWNPDDCPADLLPWLAWAFSVDEWDNTWTEQEKRDVIKGSVYVHKKKGTIGAIDRALRPLGYLIDVIEWFETEPVATPFTFKVVVGTTGRPIDEALYGKIERLINSAKNIRSQLTSIIIKAEVRGSLFYGGATLSGEIGTVYPYNPGEVGVSSGLYYAAACHIIETVTVNPQ